MDPKLSGLDPKLREAYERVMSAPSSAPTGQNPLGEAPAQPPLPSTPPQQQTAPQPSQPIQTTPSVPPSNPPHATIPEPVLGHTPPTPPTAPSPSPSNFSQAPTPASSTIAFNAHNSSLNQGTVIKKTGSKVSTVVIMIALIILLIAYTVVWIYIFKLKIPFLPF